MVVLSISDTLTVEFWLGLLLATAATVVVTVVIEMVADEPLARLLHRVKRFFQRVHRFEFPQDEPFLRASSPLLRKSHEIYARLPYQLADDDAAIERWLREDAMTRLTEEIWLIARHRFRVSGVLYATLYKHPQNRCLVWGIATRRGLVGTPSQRTMKCLWDAHREVVKEKSADVEKDWFEFYFPALHPNQSCLPPWDADERERRVQYLNFLDSIGARVVDFQFRIPDLENYMRRDECHGLLLYLTLGTRRGRDGEEIRADEVTDFVYETAYAWAWEYGSKEMSSLPSLEEVVRYLRGVADRVRAREIGSKKSLALLRVDDPKVAGLASACGCQAHRSAPLAAWTRT